jgi:hypothetical protein
VFLLCRAHHELFLDLSGCPNTTALLNPHDAMNVMSAINLGHALAAVSSLDPAQLADQPLLVPLWRAECILGELFKCLWGIYDVNASLTVQLTGLSQLAHMLAFLYEGTGSRTKFLPAQLYHDMQAMVKNAFFTVAKVKQQFPDTPVYLFQLGDNAVEEMFSTLRTLTHQRNMDIVELGQNITVLLQLYEVYSRHPEWYKQRKHLSPRDDRDRPWAVKSKERTPGPDFDLRSCWVQGRSAAASIIAASKLADGDDPAGKWFADLESRAVADAAGSFSLLQPAGKPIGVGVVSEEEEGEQDSAQQGGQGGGGMRAEGEEAPETDISPTTAAADWEEQLAIHATSEQASCWFEVDGARVHKMTAVRMAFDRQQGSTDRVKRVMGTSKWGGSSKAVQAARADSDDPPVCVGDPMACWAQLGNTAGLVIFQVSKLVGPTSSPTFSLGPDAAASNATTVHGRALCLVQQGDGEDEDASEGEEAGATEPQPNNPAAQSVGPWQWDGNYAGQVLAKGHMAFPVNPAVADPWADTLGLQQTIEFQHEQLLSIAEQARVLISTDSNNHPTLVNAGSYFPYRDSSGKAAFSEGATGAAAAGKFKCLVCESRKKEYFVPVKQMRKHLAAHMVKNHVDMTACGFCGKGDCVAQLSKYGTKQEPIYQVPTAACNRYWVKLKYVSAIGDKSKCTNVPMQCPECPTVVWKYAMAQHYHAKHAASALPEKFVLTSKEKSGLKLPKKCQ